MISIPIYEAKNKLPLYIRMVEEGESFQITRHGTPVAYLINTEEAKETNSIDKFAMVMQHWRDKYSECFLSQEEEQEYFEPPRQTSCWRTGLNRLIPAHSPASEQKPKPSECYIPPACPLHQGLLQ